MLQVWRKDWEIRFIDNVSTSKWKIEAKVKKMLLFFKCIQAATRNIAMKWSKCDVL